MSISKKEPRRSRMRWRWGVAALTLLGLAAATALVVAQGADAVIQALTAAGWIGVLMVAAARLPALAVGAVGWRLLVPRRGRCGWGHFLWFAWVREAVNGLLPVARIGGEIAATRLMMRAGMRGRWAAASLVVETTLSVFALLAFIFLGLALFAGRVGGQDGLTGRLLIGALLMLPLVAGLYLFQHFGAFGLIARAAKLFLGQDRLAALTRQTGRLDRAIAALYKDPRRLAACAAWEFLAWCLGAFEIVVASHLVGHPLSWTDALILEAMIQAASSAAFFIPAALGAQEGAFLLFGGLLGLSAPTALAIALLRRGRDLVLYLPALLVWQWVEGQNGLFRLYSKRRH